MDYIDFSNPGGFKLTGSLSENLMQQAVKNGFRAFGAGLGSLQNYSLFLLGLDNSVPGYMTNLGGALFLVGEYFNCPENTIPYTITAGWDFYWKIVDVYDSNDPQTFYDGSQHYVHHRRSATLVYVQTSAIASQRGTVYFLVSSLPTLAQVLINSSPATWSNVVTFGGSNWINDTSGLYPLAGYVKEPTFLSSFLGKVIVQGAVLSTSQPSAGPHTIAPSLFPVGCRPKKIKMFCCPITNTTNDYTKVYVDSIGNLVLAEGSSYTAGNTIDLSGISFFAEQ